MSDERQYRLMIARWSSDGVFQAEHEFFGPADTSIIFGRSRSSCEIYLPEPAVARRHGRVNITRWGALLIDHDTTNGTYVSNKRLCGQMRVNARDEIFVSNVPFRIHQTLATFPPSRDAWAIDAQIEWVRALAHSDMLVMDEAFIASAPDELSEEALHYIQRAIPSSAPARWCASELEMVRPIWLRADSGWHAGSALAVLELADNLQAALRGGYSYLYRLRPLRDGAHYLERVFSRAEIDLVHDALRGFEDERFEDVLLSGSSERWDHRVA